MVFCPSSKQTGGFALLIIAVPILLEVLVSFSGPNQRWGRGLVPGPYPRVLRCSVRSNQRLYSSHPASGMRGSVSLRLVRVGSKHSRRHLSGFQSFPSRTNPGRMILRLDTFIFGTTTGTNGLVPAAVQIVLVIHVHDGPGFVWSDRCCCLLAPEVEADGDPFVRLFVCSFDRSFAPCVWCNTVWINESVARSINQSINQSINTICSLIVC